MFKKVAITALASMLFVSSLYALGEVNNFKVTSVRVDKSGLGIVFFDQPLVGTPAGCIVNYVNHLSFNVNTNAGKAIYSLALTAEMTGQRIRAYGTGTCDEYGIMESWNWGMLVK